MKDQLDLITRLVDRTISCDLQERYSAVLSAIAETERFLAQLKDKKSEIEYDLLDACEIPDQYWDI